MLRLMYIIRRFFRIPGDSVESPVILENVVKAGNFYTFSGDSIELTVLLVNVENIPTI